jgi:hypothetical protein
MARSNPHHRLRTGLTLLELILALALSVLVIMAIGMAIDVHYRMLDVRRTNVEEAQVARATLKRIAEDLKSIVNFAPPDLSGLEAASANMTGALSTAIAALSSGQLEAEAGGLGGLDALAQGLSGQGTGGTGATQQPTGGQGGQGASSGSGTGGSGRGGATGGAAAGAGAGGTGTPSTGAASAATSATGEEDPAATTTPSPVKLYGTANELRFDISRLPRIDQYQALMSEDAFGATEIPSDVKTVVYFVRTEDSEFGLPEPATDGIGKGLMRTEIDQAVSSWAEQNGDTTSLYAGAKLLAKEVTGLAFQYWDGAEWFPEWDSDTSGGLPLAVEIVLTIQPTKAMSEEEIANIAMSNTATLPEERSYRLVVHLPTAIAASTRTLEADAAEIAAAELLPSEPSGTTNAPSGSGGGSQGGGQAGGGGGGGGGGFGSGGFGGDSGRGGRGEGGRGGDEGGGRRGRGGSDGGGRRDGGGDGGGDRRVRVRDGGGDGPMRDGPPMPRRQRP